VDEGILDKFFSKDQKGRIKLGGGERFKRGEKGRSIEGRTAKREEVGEG